jgi:molybdopterin-binding protein
MKLSARNQLAGTVVKIKKGIVTTEVIIRLASGDEIVSVITDASASALKLKKGARVRAVVKSTDVMIAVD